YGAAVCCARGITVPRSRIGRLVRLLRHAGSPTRVARKDWHGLRRALRSWMSSYQVTIVEDLEDFLILAPILQAPVVVDGDDCHSDIVEHIRTLYGKVYEARHRHPGLAGWVFFVG